MYISCSVTEIRVEEPWKRVVEENGLRLYILEANEPLYMDVSLYKPRTVYPWSIINQMLHVLRPALYQHIKVQPRFIKQSSPSVHPLSESAEARPRSRRARPWFRMKSPATSVILLSLFLRVSASHTFVSGYRNHPPKAAIRPVPKKIKPVFPPRLPASGLIYTRGYSPDKHI